MILVTRGTPSSSLYLRISAVISIKKESKTPLFQRENTSEISDSGIPNPRFIRSYACLSTSIIGRTNLADQLHITVFNTIVDHFDVMSCTFLADPVTTGLSICLSGDRLENLFNVRPGIGMSARHQ